MTRRDFTDSPPGRVSATALGVLAVLISLSGAGCALFAPTPEQRVKQAAEMDETAEKRETWLELAAEPHPDMQPGLRRVLKNGRQPTVRALAAEALGRLKDAKALRQATRNDPHWLVRKRSLSWLARLRGRNIDELKKTLTDDSSRLVRIEAVKLAAVHAPQKELYQLLLRALEDRSRAVRLMACAELETLTGGAFPAVRGPWQSYLRRTGLLQTTQ